MSKVAPLLRRLLSLLGWDLIRADWLVLRTGGEEKPACHNCTSKDVSCNYPKHSFVFDTHSALSGAGVCNSRLPVTSAVATTIPREGGDSSISVAPDYQIQQSSENAIEGAAQCENQMNSRTRSNIEAESYHLTSFVHDIVPWIVSTCPGSKFANSVVRLAERQRVVRNAMIALVWARCKAIPAAYGSTNQSRPDDHSYQVELNAIENQLIMVDDPLAARVARSLVAIGRLFGSRPAEWATARGEYPQSQFAFDEPLRYLLQMQAKTGKWLAD